MGRSPRELTFQSVKNADCMNCESQFDLTNIESKSAPTADFEANYVCPECEEQYSIEAEIKNDILDISILGSGEGERQRIQTPINTIELKSHSMEGLMNNIYRLVDASNLLLSNSNRVLELRDKIPEIHDQSSSISLLERQSRLPTESAVYNVSNADSWNFLQVDVHNYLASAYTFDQILESVKASIEWDETHERMFQNYKSQSRVILGLRHFTQHESLLPLGFRVNNSEPEWDVDIVIELSDVEMMEFQIDHQNPDGYKKGSDYYYSGVEGNTIDVSTRIGEHCTQAGEFAVDLLEDVHSERKESIEDYERIRDDRPEFDQYDFAEEPDEWG